MATATQCLRRLRRLRDRFGELVETEKMSLLAVLEKKPLSRAKEILELHDLLCFWLAYPDGPRLCLVVERMLSAFPRRSDLRRHRRALSNSGIAGTEIRFSFFAPTASWLADRWGERLRIDWEELEETEGLERLLPLLSLYAETPGLDELDFGLRGWLRRLKGSRETDAAYVVRRFDALRVSSFVRESMYDALDLPLVLEPGPTTPSRTLARYRRAPVVARPAGLDRGRPRLPGATLERPRSIRRVSPTEARVLIDLARAAMVPRQRDLDVFSFASPHDVRLVDFDGGLQFACIGAVPERRLMLEAVYGFLTLQNGVPIGYVLSSALFGSAEIAYNVFETYRGGEAGSVYGRVLAMARALFDVDSFTIFPFQLGQDNAEALQSGAWWFYRKTGFEPRDAGIRTLARKEEEKMARNPRHRSTVRILKRLASGNLYFSLGKARSDVIGLLSLPSVGLRVSIWLGETFGSDREGAARACSREASRILGVRSLSGFSPGERVAWERWCPLVLVLPRVARWSRRSKQDLVSVIRAKGGRSESEFVRRFDRHLPLRRAVLELARDGPPRGNP
jgi:hypothetical protein